MPQTKEGCAQLTSQQSVSLQVAGVAPQVSVVAEDFFVNPVEHAKPVLLHSTSQHTGVVHVAPVAPQVIVFGFAFFTNPAPHTMLLSAHVTSQHAASVHCAAVFPQRMVFCTARAFAVYTGAAQTKPVLEQVASQQVAVLQSFSAAPHATFRFVLETKPAKFAQLNPVFAHVTSQQRAVVQLPGALPHVVPAAEARCS